MKPIIDISGYLIVKFKADYRNNNWRFDCPFCGDSKQRFSVSVEKGVVHCWRCNYVNSILGFVSDNESVGIAESFRIVKKYDSVSKPRAVIAESNTARRSQKIPGYCPILFGTIRGPMERLAISYLLNRGLSNEEIKYWKLGISRDFEYSGRIISPFIEQGRICYFVARKFIGPGPKYKNPPLSGWGYGKAELLFNYASAAKSADEGITIVEGVYDVYATGRKSIAILGKVASPVQISKIIMMNPASINIMLDSDAVQEAYKLAEVFGEIFPTKIIIYKSGDPADNRAANPDNREEVRYSFRELVRNRIDEK